MAGLWNLPCVYVVENNRYGMGTSVARHSHHTKLYSKFRSLAGLKVN